METMNIALPESMKQFVQERVAKGGYSSVSEYIRELIRADQKRKAEERIDALLLEGIGSGEPVAVTAEYWEQKKRKLRERIEVLLVEGLDSGPSTPMTTQDWDEIEREGQRILAARQRRPAQ